MRFFVFCSLVVLAGCTKEPTPVQLVMVDAIAISIDNSRATNSLQLTGSVQAQLETNLSFRVGGLVASRPVGLGGAVKKGQLIAELDARDLQNASTAAAFSARSVALEAEAAESAAALARAEEKRLRGLDDAGAIAPLAYERARDQALIAEKQAAAAASRATSMRAQAELSSSQAQYARLTAPADGVVLEVRAEPGQFLQAGAPVVRFAAQGDREIEVFIPENELNLVQRGASVIVPGNEKPIPVKLRELAAAPDPATRTYRARFKLLQPPPARPPIGATATIILQDVNSPKESFSVPVSAIVWRNGKAIVAVVDGSSKKVSLREIEIIQLGSEFSRVRGQLAVGDLLIRSGAHSLTASQAVRLAGALAGNRS